MFWFCAALSAAGVLESAICLFLVAEFARYWLHRLLHSDMLPFLRGSHMAHHLLLYGPTQPMRADSYKDATHERFSFRRARGLHDIHHHSLSNAGRANTNFDRVFHTLATRHCALKRKGLAIALQRYTLATPLHPLDRTGEGKVAFQ